MRVEKREKVGLIKSGGLLRDKIDRERLERDLM